MGKKKQKKRRFEVWLDKQVNGVPVTVEKVDVADDATEAEIEAACQDVLEVMISNELDTGWRELKNGK